MVKVLRKYNKYILVVGGSLLMVAFLMPQAFEQLGRRHESKTYAHMGERKITIGQIGRADQEYQALKKFIPGLMTQILGVESSDHWLLLTAMAERAGFMAEGGEDARDWPLLEFIVARQLAERQAGQFGESAQYLLQQPQFVGQFIEPARTMLPELRDRAMGELRLREDEFDAAVSKARGVLRMMETFNRANILSDRRTLAGEKARADATYADCLVIPAEQLTAAIPDPTEEELKAHFERFLSTKRGQGEFGIGYTLPPRIKLEWLTLDKAAISSAVVIDPVEANKRWRTSRDKYKGEFPAEKVHVEDELRSEKVAAVMTYADQIIRAELRNAIRRLPSDQNYKRLPPDWQSERPSLEKLATHVASEVRAKHGLDMPLPTVTIKAANWLNRDDVEILDKIGTSIVRLGARQIYFADAVFLTKELIKPGDLGSELGFQVGVTNPENVPADQAGNRFYFTVLDTRPESPADSLEEVRATAIADVKRLKAYEILLGQAAAFRQHAADKGPDDLARKINEEHPVTAGTSDAKPSPLTVNRNVTFRRDEVVAPTTALNVPAAREAVEKAALSMDPTEPAVATPADQRTLAVPLPTSLSLAIIQITGRAPVVREDLHARADRAAQELAAVELREVVEADRASYPFSFKQLSSRLAYKVERDDEKSKAKAEPEQAPAPTGG